MDDNANQAERLCRQCGLCCDGTIFGYVPVATDERAAMEALGFNIAPQGERTGFAQPCPKYATGCCTIYTRRPAVCRSYSCVTLQTLEKGGIGFAEAADRVSRAKEAARRVVEAAPDAADLTEARKRWAGEPQQRLADPQTARLHFLITALNLLLDRHFRTEKQRSVIFMTPE